MQVIALDERGPEPAGEGLGDGRLAGAGHAHHDMGVLHVATPRISDASQRK